MKIDKLEAWVTARKENDYVMLKPDDVLKVITEYNSLQSDLRTLAKAVVALSRCMNGNDIAVISEQHAPAITLAQGILEGGE